MGQFLCRVADAEGRVFSHVEPAGSLEEARQKLVERGLYVYSVQSRGGRLASLLRQRGGRQIGGSEFLILNQQFNTLIKAGLPILKSLDLLATRATAPRLRPVITQIRDRVREGKSLSEAVAEAGVFSKVYSTAILAGEKSGNLPGVLDYYIAYQRVSTGVQKKILASLVYPALLISVAVIIVTYLVTGVIPKFALLYRDMNVELPAPTRLLIALTVDYRLVFLGVVASLAVAAAGIFLWSRTEEGGTVFDRFKFRLPVIGDTLLKFQVAQFSRTLATLLTGGTPLVAGLQTSCDAITSKLLRSTVSHATQMVREGESLHGALGASGHVPELALDMIEVGESSGALSPMLNSVAEFYEEEVSLRLSTLVSLIEPILLIFMGLIVAFILISLYLPIFSFSMTGTAK
ncbi:MAG: type II secretion system F family protein [Acidobacteria bacterium]|nr:MAG: type II secretion system F family protein [Acidobacteriota bacterium]PYT41727.1 MAG: type II secretion system F family protein [Acidobacteriota bacterium]